MPNCSVFSRKKRSETSIVQKDNVTFHLWYMYKPPTSSIAYMERGNNFTFITSDTAGRWQISRSYINTNSMLQHTLAPMFRPTYTDYLALVAYDRSGTANDDSGTLALGLMMADEMGGLWLGHTVPNLLDFSRDRPTFPQTESNNGHMLMCMSLNLLTLNHIGVTLMQTQPKFTRIRIPPHMKTYLPLWKFLNQTVIAPMKGIKMETSFNFKTKQEMMAIMLVRKPGDKNCLYKTFAEQNKLILDVYGHRHRQHSVCEKNYGVRNINSISLKNQGQVRYISNATDRAGFAVSTAAHWQRTGDGPIKYWVCVHSYDDGKARGVLVVCVEDYKVWQSFDNLKIKEPDC